MRAKKYRQIAESGYTNLSVYFQDGDRDTIENFFAQSRRPKRGDFYRDAIMEKIARERAIERERNSIREGRSQIDPSLIREV